VVALSNPDGQVLATFDALGPATPRPTLTDMGVPPQSNLLTGASSDGRG